MVAGLRCASAHDEGAAVELWDTSPSLVVEQEVPIGDRTVFRRFVAAMRQIEIEVPVVPAEACVRRRGANLVHCRGADPD